mmetsp:Transcript_1696/g.2504  ORF Transcript_1696/g.2504 Transcript_1696/m.2504 type:complete len:216 (+) Transcript_1696:1-648(+)
MKTIFHHEGRNNITPLRFTECLNVNMMLALSSIALLLLVQACESWTTLIPQVILATVLSTTSVDDEMFLKSLKPPTAETPQIRIPSVIKQDKKDPAVEGLVYISNMIQTSPSPADVLILTVRDIEHPDEILAGAKIPVSKVRFPFNFVMNDRNVLTGKGWNNLDDLLVVARVCPSVKSCSDEEASFKARGIAKTISLPGMAPGQSVRAGTSLKLE